MLTEIALFMKSNFSKTNKKMFNEDWHCFTFSNLLMSGLMGDSWIPLVSSEFSLF